MTSTPESVDAASVTAEPAGPESVTPEPATPTADELRLALAALDEIAPAGAVGEVQDAVAETEHVLAIRHASTLSGYPDWSWTVLLARGIEGAPTVLEVALLPTEGSLLAPAWVPWADRLAEYLAAKEATGDDDDDDEGDAEAEELESDLEADLDDDFDDDFDDVDEDGDGVGDNEWPQVDHAEADDSEADAEPDDAR